MAQTQNRQATTAAAGTTAAAAETAPATATAPAAAAGRKLTVTFTRPWVKDGETERKSRDGIVLANGSLRGWPMSHMAVNGIGIQKKNNGQLAVTMPTTANGMVQVIGGVLVPLDVPQFDGRGRPITHGVTKEAADEMKAFNDAVAAAWVAASNTGKPFEAEIEITLPA